MLRAAGTDQRERQDMSDELNYDLMLEVKLQLVIKIFLDGIPPKDGAEAI